MLGWLIVIIWILYKYIYICSYIHIYVYIYSYIYTNILRPYVTTYIMALIKPATFGTSEYEEILRGSSFPLISMAMG